MPRKPRVAPADSPRVARMHIDDVTVMNSDSYMRVFFDDGDEVLRAADDNWQEQLENARPGGAVDQQVPGAERGRASGCGEMSGSMDITGRGDADQLGPTGLDCVQLIVRVLLGQPDLEVVSAHVAVDLPDIVARDARIDVLARDSEGRRYDIEIQCDPSRAGVRRARYYAAKLDVGSVAAGSDPVDLTDAWVAFITDGDALGLGEPLCDARRIVKQNGADLGDGSHIIYADARALSQGEGELADVMHDLLCADPARMHNQTMAARTRRVKGHVTREVDMRKIEDIIFEEGVEQGMKRAQRENARRMLGEGFAADTVARLLGMTEEALAGLLAPEPGPAEPALATA